MLVELESNAIFRLGEEAAGSGRKIWNGPRGIQDTDPGSVSERDEQRLGRSSVRRMVRLSTEIEEASVKEFEKRGSRPLNNVDSTALRSTI